MRLLRSRTPLIYSGNDAHLNDLALYLLTVFLQRFSPICLQCIPILIDCRRRIARLRVFLIGSRPWIRNSLLWIACILGILCLSLKASALSVVGGSIR